MTMMDPAGAASILVKHADPRRPVEFLPEPDQRERTLTIISVDDHLVEAPDMFEGRMPSRYADQAPRIIEEPDGAQVWLMDGKKNPEIGLAAVAGRPRSQTEELPTRFEHMRPGCYRPADRVRDMDLCGLDASVLFPSALAGFAGTRFSEISDPGLGLAVMRAWNTWHLEEWANAYPTRFIACQVPWMKDPEVAAAEIRANAERGFKAVSFSEAPQNLGYPSVHSGHWDPFLAACEETETVICLHVGSSSSIHMTAADAPHDEIPILFPISAMFAAVDFLYARVPLRFPKIKIAMSEGGIGWVPGLLDRLEHTSRHFQYLSHLWPSGDGLTPLELLQRNFWFCALDDPTGFQVADRIGIDRIMIECDYPHEDSTWPDTQALFVEQLAGLTDEQIEKVTWRNAAELFRHSL